MLIAGEAEIKKEVIEFWLVLNGTKKQNAVIN